LLDESPMFGFDGAADGTLTVVMLRRTEAGWQVGQVDGPDNPDLSRVVARILGEHTPRPRPPSTRPAAEFVDQWMAEHGHLTFELTCDQRALLAAMLKRHVAEGTIRLSL
jgi:hypothetical protein